MRASRRVLKPGMRKVADERECSPADRSKDIQDLSSLQLCRPVSILHTNSSTQQHTRRIEDASSQAQILQVQVLVVAAANGTRRISFSSLDQLAS